MPNIIYYRSSSIFTTPILNPDDRKKRHHSDVVFMVVTYHYIMIPVSARGLSRKADGRIIKRVDTRPKNRRQNTGGRDGCDSYVKGFRIDLKGCENYRGGVLYDRDRRNRLGSRSKTLKKKKCHSID